MSELNLNTSHLEEKNYYKFFENLLSISLHACRKVFFNNLSFFRLRNEQRKNADLFLEIHKLKANLLNYEVANASPVEEITGQVKKELECAAQIDSNILSAVSDHSLSSISEGQETEVYMYVDRIVSL